MRWSGVSRRRRDLDRVLDLYGELAASDLDFEDGSLVGLSGDERSADLRLEVVLEEALEQARSVDGSKP